jgi:Transposase
LLLISGRKPMLGFGPPANRQARREWWRRQIQRQQDGNLTVAAFCRRLGVSTVTFYAWKRRFHETADTSSLSSENPTHNGTLTPTFLPVSMFDAGSAGHLEIALANSCVLRLTGAVDPDLLRIAIHAAAGVGGGERGAE